jgi:hypothetical protein
MKRAALIILTSVLVMLPSCKFIKEKGWFGSGKVDTMLVWQAKQDSIRVADSLNRVREQIEARERARIDSLNRIEQERLEYEARFRYHIIVGSFITPEYASSYVDYFKGEGYQARALKMPDSRFEVISAEAHDNLSAAIKRLKQYQDTVAYDAWIYIRR